MFNFLPKNHLKSFQETVEIMHISEPCFQIITLFFLVKAVIMVVYAHMHVKEKGTILEEQLYRIID